VKHQEITPTSISTNPATPPEALEIITKQQCDDEPNKAMEFLKDLAK
jgi:hypothetical protein